MDLKNQRVLVIGTGISGIAAAELLLDKGAVPILYDGNEKLDKSVVRNKVNSNIPIQVCLGELTEEVLESVSLAVISPGVSLEIDPVKKVLSRGVKLWGEIELAYQNGRGSIVAITGTNGKTTTTMLVGEIMKAYFEQVEIVGNIGTPYTHIASGLTDKAVVVAEISSFQLETIHDFHPKVSAILNITPDHLDRHHTMEEYIRIKECITENQTPEDYCILNYEDPALKEFREKLNTKVLFFSSKRTLDRGVFLQDGCIYYRNLDEYTDKTVVMSSKGIKVCKLKSIRILGSHNYENVMAAVAMAICMSVPMDIIRRVITEFQGVEHRVEYVREVNQVVYYNDSKGTNPDAAIKGIQAMNRPTYLIGGGYDKQSEYGDWIRSFDGKVKELVLIGATKEKIKEAAEGCGFYHIVLKDTLEEAVFYCAKKAGNGDAVLLSPACASWDMYANYEERGRKFKEYVNSLISLP